MARQKKFKPVWKIDHGYMHAYIRLRGARQRRQKWRVSCAGGNLNGANSSTYIVASRSGEALWVVSGDTLHYPNFCDLETHREHERVKSVTDCLRWCSRCGRPVVLFRRSVSILYTPSIFRTTGSRLSFPAVGIPIGRDVILARVWVAARRGIGYG